MATENKARTPEWPSLFAMHDDDDTAGQYALGMNAEAAILIRARCDELANDANPVAALEAFTIAVQNGICPSAHVLQWLAVGVQRWLDDQGTTTMDAAMGLKRRGQTPWFKKALLEARNDMILLDMDRLVYLGATRLEAATLIANRLQNDDWNKTKWDMEDLSVDAVFDLYARDQHHVDLDWQPDPPIEGLKRKNPLKDPEWVRDWLKRFDPQYMPEKIKSMC